MLGPLKLSISECIGAYLSLSDRVFRKKKHRVTIKGNIQGRFDSEELERAVKEVVAKYKSHGDTLLKDICNGACKVYIGLVPRLVRQSLISTDSSARQASRKAKPYTLRATSCPVVAATSGTASRFGRRVVQRRRRLPSSTPSPSGRMERNLWMAARSEQPGIGDMESGSADIGLGAGQGQAQMSGIDWNRHPFIEAISG